MNPDARIIEAQISGDEQASTRGQRIVSILQSEYYIYLPSLKVNTRKTHGHRVLHVSNGRRKLAEMQLRTVDDRCQEVTRCPTSFHAQILPFLGVGQNGTVILASRDSLERVGR